ncbi:MAG: nickel pincer cofactor biosynthesis protein LarC [Desulfobacterales bacterium]|nr:nickel pincer cofactor biosynthesis protein LarC [Desulfobacterales bacterium]
MILFLDLVSGISGDMTLGALVDLGVDVKWLQDQLRPLFKGFTLRTEIVFPQHLRAVNLFVDVTDDKSHRHYTDIKAIIQGSELSDFVKAKSLEAFERIARAEAHIHGKDIESVHFHEVGAIDSMVDIIGTFICIEKLGITRVAATKVPLGSGFVECAHGKIPVPVPATLAVLEGIPVTSSDAKTEIVTPTGAALVATLAESFGPMPEMEVAKIGYGSGKRDTGGSSPNLLRVVLGRGAEGGKPPETVGLKRDQIMEIKTHVDDMSPEILGFVMEVLLDAGALDVTFSPIQMKKNRPATCLTVLCRPEDLENMSSLILSQTSAIGVRYSCWDRLVLDRSLEKRDTRLGEVAVKRIVDPAGHARLVPEYEACKAIALAKDMPLMAVFREVEAELNA